MRQSTYSLSSASHRHNPVKNLLIKSFILTTLTAATQAGAVCSIADTSGCQTQTINTSMDDKVLTSQLTPNGKLLPIKQVGNNPARHFANRYQPTKPESQTSNNNPSMQSANNILPVSLPVAVWSFLATVLGILAFNKNRKALKEQIPK